MRLLITGGAGFIGSNLVRRALEVGHEVHCFDALTYAGHRASLAEVADHAGFSFQQGDVAKHEDVIAALEAGPFDGVLHLAAESHVDRSLSAPDPFVISNVLGTQTLLWHLVEAAKRWPRTPRVVHVSTDEVYGSLEPGEAPFTEHSPIVPTSPYAASKASSDMVALACHRTFGLELMVTRCSNNYGPFQMPEKLIPLMISKAMAGEKLPVYGDGQQRRDWLHVSDHCDALLRVLEAGRPGRVYNIGAGADRPNLEIVHRILESLGRGPELIEHVTDRLAHDRRYAIDATRLQDELGWAPKEDFDAGLETTVRWYEANTQWCATVSGALHTAFMAKNYAGR